MRALWSTATCSVASGATTEQSRSDWKSLPGLPHSMAEAGSEQQCANGGFMLPHGLSTPGNLQGFVALSSRNCSAAACRRRCIPARRLRDNLCTNWCSPVSQPRLMRFKSVSGRQILVGEDRIESDRLLQMSGLQQHPLVGIRASGRHSAVRDDGFPHVAERTQKHLLVK